MVKSRCATFVALVLGVSCCAASVYAQHVPSIREQLEGRIEQTSADGAAGANSASLDRAESGKVYKGTVPDVSAQLEGRVEDNGLVGKIDRPFGDPLRKSVRVLSGRQPYTAPLQGQADDQSFDASLSADNFNLPMQAMNPGTDSRRQMNLSANQTNLPGYGWSINGWTVNNQWSLNNSWDLSYWRINNWGIGNGWGINQGWSLNNRWGISNQPYYTPNYSQQLVNANLQNPNVYANLSYPRGTPMGSNANTNLNWSAPTAPPEGQSYYMEENIVWDAWYQRVSSALYQNWKDRGNQPGEATLHITVRKPKQIQAQVVRCDNPSASFKQGLLAAVAALNGSAVLEFPRDSQKQAVSFDSAFSAGTSTNSGSSSDRHGEMEQIILKQAPRALRASNSRH